MNIQASPEVYLTINIILTVMFNINKNNIKQRFNDKTLINNVIGFKLKNILNKCLIKMCND